MKKSFVMYSSWIDMMLMMDEEHIKRALSNLKKDCQGQDPELIDMMDKMFWTNIKPIMDHNESKRQRRIENGKKGGEAKASKSNQNVANSSKSTFSYNNSEKPYQIVANSSVNDNVNVNVNVNVNDNDNDNVNEIGRAHV